MGAYPPFKPASGYNMNLQPLDEMAFRQWAATNKVPFDPNATGPTDYDMRGYYKGLMQGSPMAKPTEINANDGLPHFTDYYKTPLHNTFSRESQWADETAPSWINGSQLATPGGRILVDEARPDSVQSIVNILMGR